MREIKNRDEISSLTFGYSFSASDEKPDGVKICHIPP